MAKTIILPPFMRNGAYMLVKPVPYGIPWRECEPRATYTPKSYIFTEFPIKNEQTSKFAQTKELIFP